MPESYAVIGNPIAQSKSPIIHSMFADACGHAISYERIEAPIDGFARTVDAFRAMGGLGINVTAPFKLDAFAYATHPSEAAKIAGAVNCMKFEADRVYAENFDGVGLVRDIVANLQTQIRGKRVLFLGAGGATRGALMPFVAEASSEIVIANRSLEKAEALLDGVVGSSRANLRACSYETLNMDNEISANRFDLILNATSASLAQALPPIEASAFARCELAYDLTYGKGLTPFLRLAKESGATRIADGVGMLVEQAAEAFLWWRGVRPDTEHAIARIAVPFA
jgi:shikimate dehydrogenase